MRNNDDSVGCIWTVGLKVPDKLPRMTVTAELAKVSSTNSPIPTVSIPLLLGSMLPSYISFLNELGAL